MLIPIEGSSFINSFMSLRKKENKVGDRLSPWKTPAWGLKKKGSKTSELQVKQQVLLVPLNFSKQLHGLKLREWRDSLTHSFILLYIFSNNAVILELRPMVFNLCQRALWLVQSKAFFKSINETKSAQLFLRNTSIIFCRTNMASIVLLLSLKPYWLLSYLSFSSAQQFSLWLTILYKAT